MKPRRIQSASSTGLLLISMLGAPVASVDAVINFDLPLGNTAAPTGIGFEPSDPGFANVGQVNGSTGVYLGNSWVLTANHVGAGNFSIGGQTYNFNGVDSHQIGGVDLRLFKLSSAPLLPSVPLSNSTPLVGQDTVLIGAGRSPTSNAPTTWYVDINSGEWVWSTTDFSQADGTLRGYSTNSGTRVVRWGTNRVEAVLADQSYGSYAATDLIYTDFDSSGATAFEAQAVTHDSGGGFFIENGGQWELAATIVTVGTYNNQPGGNNGANTAVFGNLTYGIDLSQYAEEINAFTAVPESAMVALVLGLFSGLISLRRHSLARSKTLCCRRCP